MKYDIGELLDNWLFDPDEFIARRITARDGSEKIQIRIDMGMLQLELEGRPDGQRPYGSMSLLEHYNNRVAQGTSGDDVSLGEEACEELFQEAWQYYQRYLSLFYLEDYTGVIDDSEHNIEIFELVSQRADSDEIKWYFEQYYPHAIMMQTRAKAMLALEKQDYRSALHEVELGMDRIEGFLAEWDGEALEEDLPELSFLQDWFEELEKQRPLSQKEQLERDLNVAVETENFEEAARLRDKLRTMRPFLKGPSTGHRSSLT